MNLNGQAGMSGLFGAAVSRKGAAPEPLELPPPRVSQRSKRWQIRAWHLKNWLLYRWRELPFYAFLWLVLPVLRWLVPAVTVAHSSLRLKVTTADGEVWDYGCVGRHLILTAGKNYVASCFDNTAEPESLKFHGFGSGATAAAIGDTALQTEYTTQYATDNTRPTGTQAHSTNTYTTVGVFAPDATVTNTEWGLASQAATGGGTFLDRQVYAAVGLTGSADSLTTTYTLTIS